MTKDTERLSINREVLYTASSMGVKAVVGFGGVIVFANVLGNVGLGEYQTVMAAAFVLTQIPAGVATALQKRASEVQIDPPTFLGVSLAFHVIFVALVTVGVVAANPWVIPYFGTVELTAGVVLIVATLGLFNVTNRLYAGIGYPARASWIDTVRSVFTLVFQLVLLFIGWQAFGLIAGLALATGLTALLSWGASKVSVARPTMDAARSLYAFARWSVPTGLLTNLYSSLDVLLIRAFVGAGPVGYYTVATQLVQPGAMFAVSISNALVVKSSGVDSVGGDVREDLINSVSYTALISIPIFFGALAIPNALMTTLFGATFNDAPGLVLVGIAAFQLADTFRSPFEAVVQGVDRPFLVFRVNVLVLLVYLPVALAAGWTYGLLGVIFGTLVAELVRFGAYQFVAARSLGGPVFPRPVLDQALAGVTMFVVVEWFTQTVVTITGWPLLIFVIGVGAATYFGILLAVSSHFRDTIRLTIDSVTS